MTNSQKKTNKQKKAKCKHPYTHKKKKKEKYNLLFDVCNVFLKAKRRMLTCFIKESKRWKIAYRFHG